MTSTKLPFEERLMAWMADANCGQEIQDVNSQISQLEAELFNEYEPTRGLQPLFRDRLHRWIENVADPADQQALLRLVPHLFFIGPREFEVLYRTAFQTTCVTWLIDQLGLSLEDPLAAEKLRQASTECWFCPISDSMRINAFYHLNHLSGRDLRPDWRSLRAFGSEQKIIDHTAKEGIKYVVLLEDFVGTGSQMRDAVEFAAAVFPTLPILVVPLVLCPVGEQTSMQISTRFPNIQITPVLRLHEVALIEPVPNTGESQVVSDVRRIALAMYGSLAVEDQKSVYSAFGFNETGSLVVLYTNCPDNTLPLVHHQCPSWNALFPRASRL